MDHLLRATARAEARHFWVRCFRAFVAPLIQHALNGRENARILDCGCGTGANVDLLQRFGRAAGFDLSETGLRLGRSAGRARLARGSVAAAPFRSSHFDLVTSFDVLYSLPDAEERTAFSEKYRLLRPGGYALMTVAAMEVLRGDRSVLSRELRRYNRDDLRNRVTAAGFVVERMTYAFGSLFLPLVVSRTVQRLRGLKREDEQAALREIEIPPAPINAALGAVVALEAVWLRAFDEPFGSTLICLAKKPDAAHT